VVDRKGRRRPGRTAPRSASKEWSANAQIMGHEQLGFEVGPVAHAGVLDGDFEVAARKALTAPAMAIAVATPPTRPKPCESTPSTTKSNGTVLHDSAGLGGGLGARLEDELGAGGDARAAMPVSAGDAVNAVVLQVPAFGHQIPIRIVPTSHTWVRRDHWTYQHGPSQGQLADCADSVHSTNGAADWPPMPEWASGLERGAKARSKDVANWAVGRGTRQ
jgi:hypothetical protein